MARHDPSGPPSRICFYRSHRLTGNTGFVDELCAAVERGRRQPARGLELHLRRGRRRTRAGAGAAGRATPTRCWSTMLAAGGSAPPTPPARSGEGAASSGGWDASALEALGVPVIQAVCVTSSRAAWEASAPACSPLDAATQVAIPEFDGRISAAPISFKERDAERLAGRRAGAALRRRPRALRPGGAGSRCATRGCAHSGRARAVAIAPDRVPDQARARSGWRSGSTRRRSALACCDALPSDGMRGGATLRPTATR